MGSDETTPRCTLRYATLWRDDRDPDKPWRLQVGHQGVAGSLHCAWEAVRCFEDAVVLNTFLLYHGISAYSDRARPLDPLVDGYTPTRPTP